MCRLTGFWEFQSPSYQLNTVIADMRDTLTHGGPDDAGVYIDSQTNLALGHRRLSILDLSQAGHQPMSDETGRFWIVCNGEVYNFEAIRQELDQQGVRFRSTGDTEVVLKAFIQWGPSALQKFRGMFAFAIWDSIEQRLFLCRDRVGVKPLYWYFHNDLLMFASELKSFHRHPRFDKKLNLSSLHSFLQYGYISAPDSIFQHTYKLEPGHYLIINQDKTIQKEQYWNPDLYFLKGMQNQKAWMAKSDAVIIAELEAILTESFQYRMVSDVPVGIFLSGGVDSSLVTALLQKSSSKPIQTFTIGFHEKAYNEAEFARKISEHLGTQHTECICSPEEAFEIIPKLPHIYDEPLGDPSAIPTYLVSKLAKQSVKVSLSADGGDEQFWGYKGYHLLEKLSRLAQIPGFAPLACSPLTKRLMQLGGQFNPTWQNFEDKFNKLRSYLQLKTVTERSTLINQYFSRAELNALGLTEDLAQPRTALIPGLYQDQLSSAMLLDIKTYLPDDILVKLDRASMAVALEGRDPMLDHHIMEYTLQMPLALKCKHGIPKYFLKQILYQYVPPALVDRPKKGFGIPIYDWFRYDLKSMYESYLTPNRIRRQGIFNADEVSRLLASFFNNEGVQAVKLWHLFVFQLWADEWL